MNIFIFVCGVWIEIPIDFVCLLLFLQPTKKLTEFLRKPEVQRISDSELNFIIVRSKNRKGEKILWAKKYYPRFSVQSNRLSKIEVEFLAIRKIISKWKLLFGFAISVCVRAYW